MKSATYTRRIKNSREIVGVSTVTFGSKNEPTPNKTTIRTIGRLRRRVMRSTIARPKQRPGN